MLPVCSATTSCSCHLQIPVNGIIKSVSSCLKTFDVNCNNVYRGVLNFSKRINFEATSFKRQPGSCFYSNYGGSSDQCCTTGMINSLHQSEFGNIRQLTKSSYKVGVIDTAHGLEPNVMVFVDNSSNSAGNDRLMYFVSETVENVDVPPEYVDPGSTMPLSVPIDQPSVSESFNIDVNLLSDREANNSDVVSGMKQYAADKIHEAENVLSQPFDTIASSFTMAIKDANEAVDNVINDIFSFVDKSGESTSYKLTGFSSELKEASGKSGLVALDVLRRTVAVIEDSLKQGANTVGYTYSSAKQYLPPEFQDTISSFEESFIKVLSPVGTSFQQVNIALEGLEKSLGLDPNDPLIPFFLFLGLSATIWGSYRILKYSGYAGDLSPQSTLELLQGNENAVLIDIRPEDLRERDGVPDLRRTTRFRYASVTIPEVDGSVKKLLKGGREVEDFLLAVVIRNLKIVQDRSKVLVMDADGTRSKGVARALRKLGTKRPYLVQDGFRSWVKEGFRIKELKPETALTILNEDAEAILEEINLTPLKLIGFGASLLAAAYSFAEWETTLQFIGVVGLSQTIYRRLASYQGAEDFKKDVSLLLAPVRVGGQAISWASGKLEPSRNGLPTSPPSSSDVQSRVLQAAAKHESQQSDLEEAQDSSQMIASGNEDVNISEA